MKQRSGGVWFLATAVIAGLLAATLAVKAIRGREIQAEIFVAAGEISAFAPLKAELFRKEMMPARLVPADAVRDVKAVEGRFARGLLLSGTVLREGHLATARVQGAITARLTEANQPGARALALSVDEAGGVGGTVEAGDKVDVIAAVKLDLSAGAGGVSVPVAKVIARAVPVLFVQPPGDTGRKGTVVLQVTPEVAEEIGFAQMAGTVYLATNPYNTDPQAADTRGMTPQRFMEKHGLGAQAARP